MRRFRLREGRLMPADLAPAASPALSRDDAFEHAIFLLAALDLHPAVRTALHKAIVNYGHAAAIEAIAEMSARMKRALTEPPERERAREEG